MTTSSLPPLTTQLMANLSLDSLFQAAAPPPLLDSSEQDHEAVRKADGHVYATEYNSKPAADGRQHSLGASLNEDVSRIIQQESASSLAGATGGQETSGAKSDISQAAAPGSEAAKAQAQAQARAQAQAQAEAEQQAKEMKKFDYDLLPAAASPVAASVSPNALVNQHSDAEAAQLAQLVGYGEQPASGNRQQPQQALLGQVDFVSQPPAQPAAPNGFRRRTSKPVAPQQQQQAATGGAGGPLVERVPIYRSLFKKTLKSDISPPAQPAAGAPQQPHRYAIRRRRDRAQQQQQPQQAQRKSVGQMPAAQEAQALAAPQAGDSAGAKQEQPARATNGVASYLQLLNNRYHFRLNRAAHQQQQPQQLQQQSPLPALASSSGSP